MAKIEAVKTLELSTVRGSDPKPTKKYLVTTHGHVTNHVTHHVTYHSVSGAQGFTIITC